MGIILSMVRAGVALVLGVIIFVGFMFFLVLNSNKKSTTLDLRPWWKTNATAGAA